MIDRNGEEGLREGGEEALVWDFVRGAEGLGGREIWREVPNWHRGSLTACEEAFERPSNEANRLNPN